MREKGRIIVALDIDSLFLARRLARRLYPKIKIFKIGSQLFTGFGPKAVEAVRKTGAEVFLDLKFFDIPNTVANAVRQATRLKVQMMTLHILGGRQMLEAAVGAAKEESRRLKIKRPLLIGVTVLTSDIARPQEVLQMAKQGIECGLDGVVCSVKEAALIRKSIKKKFFIVTPGIRSEHAQKADQQRTATVEEAIKAGSDYLVIGRPVLSAVNPVKEAAALVAACRKN